MKYTLELWADSESVLDFLAGFTKKTQFTGPQIKGKWRRDAKTSP